MPTFTSEVDIAAPFVNVNCTVYDVPWEVTMVTGVHRTSCR